MNRPLALVILSSASLIACSAAHAQVGIDGTIGADWSGPGVTIRSVAYDPAAPLGNFGTPGNTNHAVAYNTYFRSDGAYIYAAVAADTSAGGSAAGLTFANLYFSSTLPNGSIAMEVTNNRFFRGGVTTGGINNDGFYDATGYATRMTNAGTGVVEVAIPVSFFFTDPLAMGFATSIDRVRWNLSQSLGYSVAGGAGYGDDRLGQYIVPTPGSLALLGLGGLAATRRRRA